MRVHSFDPDTGKAVYLREYENPFGTFLALNHAGTRLYNGSEVNGGDGIITVYDISCPEEPERLCVYKECDQGAAYLATDPSDSFLITCSYFSGTVKSYRLDENGLPEKLIHNEQLTATGPVGKDDGPSFGQQSPRTHGIAFIPGTDLVCVSDYSGDRLLCYRLEKDGEMTPVSVFAGIPGDAVRHAAVHPARPDIVYVNTEYSGRIYVLRCDRKTGALKKLAAYPALTDENASMSASLHISADGKWLLSSNRTNENISVFRISEDGKTLTAAPPITGVGPVRDFIFAPFGRHLLVGDQKQNRILTFAWDPENGPGALLSVLENEPTPATFVFAP